MANTPVVVLDDTMTSIANAIRSKTGGSATMTPGQMPAQIASIPSGGGGTGITREVDANGKYGYPTQSFSFSLPSDATGIGSNALYSAFNGCTGLTSVDLSSLTTVSGSSALYSAFNGCTSLASASFPALTTVSGSSALNYAFNGCTSLASASFPALTTVSGSNALYYAFQNCTSLTSVSFPALTAVTGNGAMSYTFRSCTSLTSVGFPALTTSSFGSRTSQFNNMLQGVTGCTVHFPAAIQSTIGSWSDVTNGFGGTNTTVLFDL